MRFVVGVVGAANCDRDTSKRAEEVGELLAGAGCTVVCGGLHGVMEGACRGARKAGGTTVGILPGESRFEANEYVDVAVATGMGEARNAIVVKSSDAIIAISGGYGTLSEIAFALKSAKPVVSLGSWNVSDEVIDVKTPKEAVETVLKLLRRKAYV